LVVQLITRLTDLIRVMRPDPYGRILGFLDPVYNLQGKQMHMAVRSGVVACSPSAVTCSRSIIRLAQSRSSRELREKQRGKREGRKKTRNGEGVVYKREYKRLLCALRIGNFVS
jgi:hypothetical protein